MQLRRSPNRAGHTPPQHGRDRLEQVVAISRNAWSQSVGTRSGVTFHLSAKLKDGTALTWDYTCTDDGKECPAKVSDGKYDTVSVKRVDANNNITVMTKKGGKFKVTDTVTTSKDGKTMSGTKEGTDANGKQVSGAFSFDRK